jgi:hypothetical protein
MSLRDRGAKQEGHDGPEIAHLYIGPLGGANFNQGAFIWTNCVDTHLKIIHDKYLSSSSKKIFKFLLYTYREKQWPPSGGPILSPGLLFEQTW